MSKPVLMKFSVPQGSVLDPKYITQSQLVQDSQFSSSLQCFFACQCNSKCVKNISVNVGESNIKSSCKRP